MSKYSDIYEKLVIEGRRLFGKDPLSFVDLCSGIGGFHIAARNNNMKCVMACEIDKYARETYKANFNINDNIFPSDLLSLNENLIPDHDLLCAGFPCQPFSQAGYKKGFNDIRGNIFFKLANIIKVKQPQSFILENVKNLKNHDNGKTFNTIRSIIEDKLGYSFYYDILKASDFGLPQNRPRLFMIGFKNKDIKFSFPKKIQLKKTMSDILQGVCNKKIGYTLRVGGRGSGINDRRNWDTYLLNNKEFRISSIHGKRMQGFDDSFLFPVSETQAMKQLGNSVAIPVVDACIRNIISIIRHEENEKL